MRQASSPVECYKLVAEYLETIQDGNLSCEFGLLAGWFSITYSGVGAVAHDKLAVSLLRPEQKWETYLYFSNVVVLLTVAMNEYWTSHMVDLSHCSAVWHNCPTQCYLPQSGPISVG